MSIFKNLTTENHEEKEDRLGGFRVLNTDIYEGTIKLAYAVKSAGGAHGVTLVVDMGGSDFTNTQYVTNKKGENFFHPKDKDGKPNTSKRNSLPGFTIIDDLCLVTTGKPLSEQDTEEKVVKLYNSEEQKELPTSVPMLVDLVGQKAYFAIFKDLVNKNEKGDDGQYRPTAETREENSIEKVFHYPSKVTVAEARKADETGVDAEPVFFDAWKTKNAKGDGQPRDRRTIKDDGPGARSGRPGGNKTPPAGGGEKRTTSLFNKG